jgi:dinuclear metal center YbgI/SA1388 family protein
MKLDEVCIFLDEYLNIVEYQDVSNNGLQVEGKREVSKIAFAVDACMESFRAAKKSGADMLVVHHGMIWGGIDYVRGMIKRRIEYLLKNGISLYAAHLPLDAHPEVGNNAIILRKIGLDPEKKFGDYKGVKIGYSAKLNRPAEIGEVVDRFSNFERKLLSFGNEKIRSVAAVSGRGGFAVKEAIECRIDLLITGEAEHEIYHIAREGNINVLFLGHYASECFGVNALKEVVEDKTGLEAEFIDIPTGL